MDDETEADAGAGPVTDEGPDAPERVAPEEIPDGATGTHWKQLVLEMEESASRHGKSGWDTLTLHPTASGVVDDPESGIGVVVDREEFEGLDALVSRRQVNEYEVLRADLPDEIQVLVILYTADAEAAVFLPAAVDADRLDDLREQVDEKLFTHVTPEDDDETVSFTHDDPSLFFPGTEMPRSAETRSGLADDPDDSEDGSTDETGKTDETDEES
ncbi:hypothetical protein BRC89_05300 [Halobacteriales archaeon QS_4_70_19]|nr:MAG: hypothetical protein BRC89_05300 [Halobacteriales archaeon QS_4_70_19]